MGMLARLLPFVRYRQEEEALQPLTEDAQTYQAILEDNRNYLAGQVFDENERSRAEEEETRTAEEELETAVLEENKESGDGEEQRGQDGNTGDSREDGGASEERTEGKETVEGNGAEGNGAEGKDGTEANDGTEGKDSAEDDNIKNTPSDEKEEKKKDKDGEADASGEESSEKHKKKGGKKKGDAGKETREAVAVIPAEKLQNSQYLLNNFFIVDAATRPLDGQIAADVLLEKDMSLPESKDSPQILIYHSHSQETYKDSQPGEPSHTVVGVGDYLTELLQETYGFSVIHVRDTFDVINGVADRSSAYDYARERVEQVLAENPEVEVVIDLHRDGVPEEKHLVAEVDGKQTAQIMFFNGLSYSAQNGPIAYLPNPNLSDNLAFSFQLQLASKEYFPGFTRPIYLSSLRYNLHLKPRALLVEVGAQNNTVEEAKNAMEPLAWLLDHVLRGKG